MHKLGVLAYGSLIDDPGKELEPLIVKRINGVFTPFRVEFARKSQSRGDAPTLIPNANGTKVKAVILILPNDFNVNEAKNILFRREIHQEETDRKYEPDKNVDSQNKIWIEVLDEFNGVEKVLYTKIASNIDELSPKKIADLAIKSVKIADENKDGITYLINSIQNGIATSMTKEYIKEILNVTGCDTLSEALKNISVNKDRYQCQ